MSLVLLLSAAVAGDVERLGSADYHARESAEVRLRLWGLVAVPELLDATRSDCPERRVRAGRLLTPWLRYAADLRAAAVLLDPWPVGLKAGVELFGDAELRHRMARLMATVDHWGRAGIHLEAERDSYSWWGFAPPKESFLAKLMAARQWLGVRPVGWPCHP